MHTALDRNMPKLSPPLLACFTTALTAITVGCHSAEGDDSQSARVALVSVREIKVPADLRATADLETAKFNRDLLAETVEKRQNENLVFSPFGVEMALQLLWEGSSGSTRTTIAQGLRSKMPLDDRRKVAQAYLHELQQGPELRIANGLWVTGGGAVISPEYSRILYDSYGGVAKTTTWATAPTDINDWVRAQTNGKIDKFLDKPGEEFLYLVNAVSFSGRWDKPFDKTQTHIEGFKTTDGKEVPVQMMHAYQVLTAAVTPTYTAIAIPFKNKRFEMVLRIDTALSSDRRMFLNEPLITAANSQQYQVRLALPKFEFRTSWDLMETITALGMGSLKNHADLTAMGPGCSGILSSAWQKAYIHVDEDGAEAVAATGLAMKKGGPHHERLELKFDRPFAWMIQDCATHKVVFLGYVNNPKT